ncbi:MAG: S8 family serine peptidase [Caldilineaceae bacterium]|nr:S8 family serine peptidase [Caldilineaceae bacterium]
MTAFVAVRKREKPVIDTGPAAASDVIIERSVEERRSAAINDTLDEAKAEMLLSLGLTQVDPLEHSPNVHHSFHKLDFLKAYVIDTPNPAVAEHARELLEPDYIVAPNIDLTLPKPELHRKYRALPSNLALWPEVSGVAEAHKQGVRGQGVLVGVLDTGCDADHIELRDKLIDFRYVPLVPETDVMRACRGFDVDGHGTHVCGIIGGKQVGVAPDVELMAASVIESETLRTSLERVVIALNWMMAQFQLEENLHKPTIINISLGYRREWIGEQRTELAIKGIQQILNTLVYDYNVLPIVAVGNDGPGRTRAPAYFPETLSVGAVDRQLMAAYFSGGGQSPILTQVEPDLVGFGVDIFSSLERTIDNHSVYARASGTSMAAPYVAGIAALAASADPTLQGEKLRAHLLANAWPLDEPSDRVGAGLARFI